MRTALILLGLWACSGETDTGPETETETDTDTDTDTDSDTDTDTDTDVDDEAVPGDAHYKVDQLGYLPDETKVAVISQARVGQLSPEDFEPGATLEVRNYPEGEVVFTGSPVLWSEGEVSANSGDRGWWFDFSSVTEPGRYRIHDPDKGLSSHVFSIDDNVYADALVQAARTYFYQREAFAKQEPWADARWTDEAAFLNDEHARYVLSPDDASLERDVSGGWMDAGDTNKYVTFADGAVSVLLTSYQRSPQAWGDDHGIPESGNGIPDLLDEVRYELAWMSRMQDADGGVFIKSGDLEHWPASPPSSHDHPRYYGPKCSSAAITLAAVFAQAGVVFRDVPGLSGDVAALQEGAEAAWSWYRSNPRSTSCDNGEILSGDADMDEVGQDRREARATMWLWALTGEEAYHDHFRASYTVFEQLDTGWWGPYRMSDAEAALWYTEQPGADAAVAAAILDSKRASGGWSAGDELYRAAMPSWSYHWGHNMPRADAGTLNTQVLEHGLDPGNESTYRQRALDHLHWLHGVNPLGKLMLSNMVEHGAEDSVTEFYHSWFADGTEWDSILTETGPPPGYLVGGPNASYSGDLSPPAGEPPAKSYVDFNTNWPSNSWEVTENGIYYQAAYLRLVASFVDRS